MVSPTGINQLSKTIAEQGLKENTGKPQDVNPGDQARLQDALQNNTQTDPGVQASQSASSVQNANQADSVQPSQPGDWILRNMDKMRSEAQSIDQQLNSSTAMSSMTPQELLQAQLKISRVMFNEQLTGQVTGKIEQDMDTVLKSQ